MPKTHTHTTYSYEELSEAAKVKAVEEVREMLVRTWDSGDLDDIRDTIIYSIAEKFKAAGWDTYGQADFPGIDGFLLPEWNTDENTFLADGYITPQTAPGLPWPDKAQQFVFGGPYHYSYLEVEDEDGDSVYAPQAVAEEFLEKVREVIFQGLKDGATEAEYKTSEESARNLIDDGDWEFNEDGTLHR